ncbi:MAG: tetratricopeptide repeat protein [Rhizomicrobium sp.]
MRFAPVFLILLVGAATAAPMKPTPPHNPSKPPIDVLFAQLAKAESTEEAKPIEDQIFAYFEQSGSASVDLLMARGAVALAEGDDAVATKLFTSVTSLAPGFAEGWHQRAQLQQQAGDDENAMLSLQKVVTLNPRQFEAMSELGDLLEDYGNKPGALKLYRRALALDPQLDGASKHLRALEKDVEGQGI